MKTSKFNSVYNLLMENLNLYKTDSDKELEPIVIKKFIMIGDENDPRKTDSFSVALVVKLNRVMENKITKLNRQLKANKIPEQRYLREKKECERNLFYDPQIKVSYDFDLSKYFIAKYKTFDEAKISYKIATSGLDEFVKFVILHKEDVANSTFLDILKNFHAFSNKPANQALV